MEKRKKGRRKSPEAILVVCEGYTEENLVLHQRNRKKLKGITILNTKGCSPNEIVEIAKRKYIEDDGYDAVYYF